MHIKGSLEGRGLLDKEYYAYKRTTARGIATPYVRKLLHQLHTHNLVCVTERMNA